MTDNAYFFEYMKGLLGAARYSEFMAAYTDKPRHKALRVNTLKISVEDFIALYNKPLKPNPLCSRSFYCDVKPSLDPLYHAGLYYMQEPSASAAVAAFAPYIGERVLDLCAAPGGKSTQVAACMNGGILFCNDAEYKRVGALRENVERLGVKNAVVTFGEAADYRKCGFDGFFDTLVVDAPCSGGGMMRYEDVPYTPDIVEGCAARQRAILDDAAELLCRGGYMLYSTCTFAERENEDNIRYLLAKGFETVDIPLACGVERGIGIADARRIYPMNFDGEGHFYCVLKKLSGCLRADMPSERNKRVTLELGGLTLDCIERDGLPVLFNLDVPRRERNDLLIYKSVGAAVYDPMCVSGKNRTRELDHALSHALDREQAAAFGAVELGDMAKEYLCGEQLNMTAPRGDVIVTYKGYALGFGRCSPSGNGEYVIKNRYPKSLRVAAINIGKGESLW